MAHRSPLARRQEEQVSSIDGFTPRSSAPDALGAELESHLPSGWSVERVDYAPTGGNGDTPTCTLTISHTHAPVTINVDPASTARAQCAVRPQNSHRVTLTEGGETHEKVDADKMHGREAPAEVFEPVVAVAKSAINKHGLWLYTGGE